MPGIVRREENAGLIFTAFMTAFSMDWIWVFKKWTIYNSHNHPADELGKGSTDWLTKNTDWFNGYKIERIGNTIHVYVHGASTWGKWKKVGSRDLTKDYTTVPETFYIGFYAAHTKPYRYDFEAQFDNVYVESTPW